MRASLRALVVATAVAFVPDIVVPGTRGIEVVTRLDLGPLADKVKLAYEVQKGDTLTAIARDRLGDEKRLPDWSQSWINCAAFVEPSGWIGPLLPRMPTSWPSTRAWPQTVSDP